MLTLLAFIPIYTGSPKSSSSTVTPSSPLMSSLICCFHVFLRRPCRLTPGGATFTTLWVTLFSSRLYKCPRAGLMVTSNTFDFSSSSYFIGPRSVSASLTMRFALIGLHHCRLVNLYWLLIPGPWNGLLHSVVFVQLFPLLSDVLSLPH